MGRTTRVILLLLVLSLVASSCSLPSTRKSDEYKLKDGTTVRCSEPPPDVVVKGIRANGEIAAEKVGNLLKGTGGVGVDIERIRQEVSSDVAAFEVIEYRICLQYVNGVLSKEEYRSFTERILPALKTSQLGVEGDPYFNVIPKDQALRLKVTKFARIKVINISGPRVTNVGAVVIKMNNQVEGRFRLAVSSVDTLLERPNPPAPQISVDLNPGEDAYFDAVIECNGKTCPNGKLAIPYVDNRQIFVSVPVIQGVELLENFTVRVSGDMASAVIRTFSVKSSTKGYLVLQAK